ncbi:MAG: hypothetical protein ICV79_29595, partial [Flavisolibacter sp.]|nr:hypothetical protein [Flavisolibacter sp.]
TVKGTLHRFRHNPRDPFSISCDSVMALAEDNNGNLWITTAGGGLNRYDEKKQIFVHYRHEDNNKNSLISDSLRRIRIDQNGILWIASNAGLERMDPKTETFTHYRHSAQDTNSISGNNVTDLLLDHTGRLWIGIWGSGIGLNLMDPNTGKFKRFLQGLNIDRIYEDTDGIIWVWTGIYYGLYQLNRSTGQFVNFGDPDAKIVLSNTAVFSMTEDQQKNLWIGTLSGIIELNRRRKIINIYGTSQGVSGVRLFYSSAAYCNSSNELFFGDLTGYYQFKPGELSGKGRPPQIVFSDFKLSNKIVKPGLNSLLSQPLQELKEIKLRYKQNIFSIDFATIDYSNPGENRTMYLLENYDNVWRRAGAENSAFYFHVPPGHYVFRVKGVNGNGIWAEKAITIIIMPPWWRTWWAYCLYGLLFVAGVIAVDSIRRRQVVAKERAKAREREVAQAREIEKAYNELKRTQAQLIQSEKMASLGQLTAGIAHEIQNPLNFVTNFSEVNKELIEELEQANT